MSEETDGRNKTCSLHQDTGVTAELGWRGLTLCTDNICPLWIEASRNTSFLWTGFNFYTVTDPEHILSFRSSRNTVVQHEHRTVSVRTASTYIFVFFSVRRGRGGWSSSEKGWCHVLMCNSQDLATFLIVTAVISLCHEITFVLVVLNNTRRCFLTSIWFFNHHCVISIIKGTPKRENSVIIYSPTFVVSRYFSCLAERCNAVQLWMLCWLKKNFTWLYISMCGYIHLWVNCPFKEILNFLKPQRSSAPFGQLSGSQTISDIFPFFFISVIKHMTHFWLCKAIRLCDFRWALNKTQAKQSPNLYRPSDLRSGATNWTALGILLQLWGTCVSSVQRAALLLLRWHMPWRSRQSSASNK